MLESLLLHKFNDISPIGMKSMALYFVTVHGQQVVGHFDQYLCSKAKPYIRAINGSAFVN